MLSHVFEMFAQVDAARGRSHGGLGIGLSLVQRLVRMHGGTVTAHSEGAGHGSEFVVRLPLSVEPGIREDAPPRPAPHSSGGDTRGDWSGKCRHRGALRGSGTCMPATTAPYLSSELVFVPTYPARHRLLASTAMRCAVRFGRKRAAGARRLSPHCRVQDLRAHCVDAPGRRSNCRRSLRWFSLVHGAATGTDAAH
jgi:hypothetical protein